MELKIENLNLSKEKTYFIVALIISIIAWVFIVISISGLVIAVFLAIFGWLAHGLLVAHLKSGCVKVDPDQMPKLYENYKDVCEKLHVEPPELYVLQSGGVLNAFATRFSGRSFVVLHSDIVEAFDQGGDEIRFLFGHEIGHLKSKHSLKHILLIPALGLPLLGPAYHRACEASCDRYGAFATKNMDGAIKALMVLSGGKNLYKEMDPLVFSGQFGKYRGFFVSWHELISGYPTLSQRVANMVALKNDQPVPQCDRDPFSYIFALFSFGSGSANMGGIIVVFVVIGILAAIALPNLERNIVSSRMSANNALSSTQGGTTPTNVEFLGPMSSNDALAKATLRAMSTASESYGTANNGNYPGNETSLTGATPPFLNNAYCANSPIAGYDYDCSGMSTSGYTFTATPVTIGRTGSTVFIITTGGVLTP